MPYQQYINPSSEKWIKIGYWYQEHKLLLFKFFLGFLITINAIFWIYTFYGIIKIVVNSDSQKAVYNEIALQRSDTSQIHQAMSPKPPVFGEVFVAASQSEQSSNSGADMADFASIVENPSQNYLSIIDYSFSWGSGKTSAYSARVLPGEKMPLFAFGSPVESIPKNVLIDSRVSYKRVKDKSKVLRAKSAISSINVIESGIEPKNGVTDVIARIKNAGSYSIIDPSFIILVKNLSSEVLAVGYYKMDKLESGKTEIIKYRWMRPIPGASSVTVYPVFDFLDDSVYRFRKNTDFAF